ncbi:MAG: hypothetical protein IPM24_24195 [Bryobacterales bacterium]|jgi:hypothetical protein|nr:hypothetical protein [Bryobacterales bacterium]
MFDSLSDRMKQDDEAAVTTRERVLRWVAVSVLSILIFGGLYLGLLLIE